MHPLVLAVLFLLNFLVQKFKCDRGELLSVVKDLHPLAWGVCEPSESF
jgi:hypothetical protein